MALLEFLVHGAAWALPVTSVREILAMSPVTPLPQTGSLPPSLLGITTVRDQVVPVIDLARLAGQAPNAAATPTLVLLTHGQRVIGLVVDEVKQLWRGAADDLTPPPLGLSADQPGRALLRGIIPRDGGVVCVLSPDAIVAALNTTPLTPDSPEPVPAAVAEIRRAA